MKIIKVLTLAALAATLLFQPSRAIADNSAPIRLTFEKSLAGGGPAPYLFHFTGSFGGDFTGTLFTGVLVREFIDQLHQIVHLEADYVFTGVDGNYLFTAHVEGNSNLHTGKAVLNGLVTDGSLEGAQVHFEFESVECATRCYQGTMRIMPASAD